MTGAKSPWGTALLAYAAYRRTVTRFGGKRGSPKWRLLVRVLLVTVTMPVAVPILWHALLVMPAPLAVFIASAMVLRFVRWFLRQYR